ncbi:ATP-binding protein [Pseudotenacibaculum sp. MALMAid0570]|uniref:ATP-binding protein n=1 Tax=Pseudotenacibaculum sp. MALMAid0570 TaxID=3143938 RepID=UPI0032DFC364
MAKQNRNRLRCISILQKNRVSKSLNTLIADVVNSLGLNYQSIYFQRRKNLNNNNGVENIQQNDIIIVDATLLSPNLFYELGIAQANGKQIIYLIEESFVNIPDNLRAYSALPYDPNRSDFRGLGERIKKLLLKLIKIPNKKSTVEVFPKTVFRQPHVIDLENLDMRTFENMCYELIVQMGYRQVEWEKSNEFVDMLATYPKSDPDGFEYGEQWFISIADGFHRNKEFDMLMEDPAYMMDRLLRKNRKARDRGTDHVTLLFITKSKSRYVENFIRRYGNSLSHRPLFSKRNNFNIRFRHWTLHRIVQLLHEYPNIVTKYFSEDAYEGSKYRKNFEELYKENITITDELQKAKDDLEKEKKLRFIAERDAAWKDVAFKAAHKLGNPIDAIDTFLQSLKKRINDDCKGALNIANEIDTSVEDAKLVIDQFKSLTKVLNIKLSPVDIEPIITHASMPYKEKGIKVEISVRKKCPKLIADQERLTECFQELFANSSKWFDENKGEKKVNIKVIRPTKATLPDKLNKNSSYLKITFSDNGKGVPYGFKEKMFSPFISKSTHGTGLGLSLVQSIIEKHGGIIFETGIHLEGAQFQIYLPISN